VLPIAVLRDEVFRIAGLLSLIVGFALFGSVTFLPLFFQTVFHASPTGAGLRLVPLMGGLVLTSVASGRLISRTGRYKVFPVVGTAITTVGLLLLSRLDVGTSAVEADLYLLVLGLGLGMVMQVLVLAVQNAIDHAVLGSATSGVTLARAIGGSIGAAVFGTIFSTRLRTELHHALGGSLGTKVFDGGRLTRAQVTGLPAAARLIYENAYVHALQPVFLVAAAVTGLGVLLSLRLRERPLRATASTSQGLDDVLEADPRNAPAAQAALPGAGRPETLNHGPGESMSCSPSPEMPQRPRLGDSDRGEVSAELSSDIRDTRRLRDCPPPDHVDG
jgi:hypothetical protein